LTVFSIAKKPSALEMFFTETELDGTGEVLSFTVYTALTLGAGTNFSNEYLYEKANIAIITITIKTEI